MNALVVVNDLDFVGITIVPAKADPPLIIDPDTVLPGAIALELLEPVARRDTKVVQRFGGVHGHQLPQHDPAEVSRISADRLPVEEPGCVAVTETCDHPRKLTRRVNNVKRYYIAANARVKLRAHLHLRSRSLPPLYLMPAAHQSALQALVASTFVRSLGHYTRRENARLVADPDAPVRVDRRGGRPR